MIVNLRISPTHGNRLCGLNFPGTPIAFLQVNNKKNETVGLRVGLIFWQGFGTKESTVARGMLPICFAQACHESDLYHSALLLFCFFYSSWLMGARI